MLRAGHAWRDRHPTEQREPLWPYSCPQLIPVLTLALTLTLNPLAAFAGEARSANEVISNEILNSYESGASSRNATRHVDQE